MKSGLDLNTLLPLSREMLGYSPAKAADGAAIPLTGIPHQLACVAAFKNPNVPPTVRHALPQLGLFSVGFIIAADERDMVKIIEATHGMEIAVTDTVQTGIQSAIICGTLAQWQRAVKMACNQQVSLPRNVRHTFNMVYRLLVEEGLREMFDDVKLAEQPDHTFLLLEYKR